MLKGCGKSCWERESRNPKDIWLAFINPVSELLDSVSEVHNPHGQGFQGIICEFPFVRYLVFIKREHNLLKFLTDQYQTIDTFLQVIEILPYHSKQFVVSTDLLNEDDFQWVLILRLNFLIDFVFVEGLIKLVQHLCDNFFHLILGAIISCQCTECLQRLQ